VIELGIAAHVMKVHGGLKRWPHDHKGMKHEGKIMMIDEEQSYQGKGIVGVFPPGGHTNE